MLRVLADYKSKLGHFVAGQMLDKLTAMEERALLSDAPGCFEVVEAAKQAPTKPGPASRSAKRSAKRPAKQGK